MMEMAGTENTFGPNQEVILVLLRDLAQTAITLERQISQQTQHVQIVILMNAMSNTLIMQVYSNASTDAVGKLASSLVM